MARSRIENDPISHCPHGQGGRSFARMKKRNKTSSERRPLRVKVQPIPTGRNRWKFGFKYTPIDVELDKTGRPINWVPTPEWI
jgi:hypothetical protein